MIAQDIASFGQCENVPHRCMALIWEIKDNVSTGGGSADGQCENMYLWVHGPHRRGDDPSISRGTHVESELVHDEPSEYYALQ